MKVCFLGLGSMGSGVCRNLLNKGYALQVWNRSPEKAAKVAGWGAEAFATPQEAARGAGVVMSCLSSVAALKAVAGGEDGVFSCMGEGMAFYDMGTWDIESVLALEAEAERHGVRYVYMPMGKGPEAAEAGESPLFFGGSKDVYERDKAFLSDIGEVFYLGDVKAACAFKLITNLIGLSNNRRRVPREEDGPLRRGLPQWGEVHRRLVLPDAELGAQGVRRSLPAHARYARQRLERYEVRRGDGGRGGSFLPGLRHAQGSLQGRIGSRLRRGRLHLRVPPSHGCGK